MKLGCGIVFNSLGFIHCKFGPGIPHAQITPAQESTLEMAVQLNIFQAAHTVSRSIWFICVRFPCYNLFTEL